MSGCTLIADLEDYGPGIPACEDGNSMEIRDLWLVLERFEQHEFQRIEVRVISDGEGDNDFLVALGVLDGLPSADYTFYMRRAIPAGNHRIDFWADRNGNGVYDPPNTDHSWSLDGCVSGAYRFTHAPNFENIEQPPPQRLDGDFVLQLQGFTPHLAQLVEVFVMDDISRRTVGYYRRVELETADASFVLPGIIEADTDYSVAFYADLNQNGRYDPPPVDHAWLVEQTSDASGLVVTFPHNLQFADIIDFIPPTGK